jgi:hypothetical protein
MESAMDEEQMGGTDVEKNFTPLGVMWTAL